MCSESTDLEARLKSLIPQLQIESGILDRLVYKGKNQHRRCPYFQWLLKVRRDVKLLQSTGLEEILNFLFQIINGKQPPQKAYVRIRQKKRSPNGMHNYQERLLGVARLLSQMVEPILKAAIQISALLAKSFFMGFSLTILALLARLRVLVQQILLDVVSVFNMVSSLSQKEHSVTLTPGGVEVFREYYPLGGDVLTLECVWEEDKFVLLERTHNSSIKNQDEDLTGALPLGTSIQYETIELFREADCTENELSSEMIQKDFPMKDSCPPDIQHAINLSADQSAESGDVTNVEDCEDGKNWVNQNFATVESASEANLNARVGSIPSPKSPRHQSKLRKEVAFVPVKRSTPLERNGSVPCKKMKLDLDSADGTKTEDPFLNLLLAGSMTDSLF